MGLRLSIYEPKDIGNCSNNGISNRYDSVVVVNVEGPSEPSETAPAVVLEWANIGPNKYPRLIPVDLKEDGAWTMMGGCYAGTSDSRWSQELQKNGIYGGLPVAIHDRVE